MTSVPYHVRANTPACTTLTPRHLEQLWHTMEREGSRRWLFYDGATATPDDYLDFMLEREVYAYAVYSPAEKPLATYFLNNFMGHAAMMHFCFFKAGLPHARAIGRDTCRFLLHDAARGGVSALIGYTPKPFRHAWRLALDVGFQYVATIPQGCRIRQGGRSRTVDAVATLCTHDTLKRLED